jgi:hypothetical protein
MKRSIIFSFVAVIMAFVCSNVSAASIDSIRVNKVEYFTYGEFTDTVFNVTVRNVEYQIATLYSTNAIDCIKNAKKLHVLTLYKAGESLGSSDWCHICKLGNGNLYVNTGNKSVEVNLTTNEVKPYDFRDALTYVSDSNNWYDFATKGRGYCYADRINPVDGNHEFTIFVYE